MIWNFTASDTSPQQQIGVTEALLRQESIMDVLLNGRNVEWGSLEICHFHARIDQLFDRDFVWAATQTMVLFGFLAIIPNAVDLAQRYIGRIHSFLLTG